MAKLNVMKKFLVAPFVLLLFIYSCKSGDNTLKEELLANDSVDSSKVNSLLELSVDCDSLSFVTFLEKFNSDPQFQLESIKFPLVCKSWNYYGDSLNSDEYLSEFSQKSEWQHIIFTEKSFSKRMEQKTELDYSFDKNKVVLKLTLPDTCLNVEYIFKCENNKWKLVEIIDSSN